MKKVFSFFLALIFIATIKGQAQQCTPQGTQYLPKQAGIVYPPIVPTLKVGETFQTGYYPLQFYFLPDTIVDVTLGGYQFNDTIVFESYTLDSVINLPPGMYLDKNTCSQANCIFLTATNEWGCIYYKGTPTQADTFNFSVLFQPKGYFRVDNSYDPLLLQALSAVGIQPGDVVNGDNLPLILQGLSSFFVKAPYLGQHVIEPKSSSLQQLQREGFVLRKDEYNNYYLLNKSIATRNIHVTMFNILGEKIFERRKVITPFDEILLKVPNAGIYFLSVKINNKPEIISKLIFR